MDGGADLSHEGGGGGVVALHVADHRDGRRGCADDEVVEVAADVHTVTGWAVAGGDVEAGESRQGVGQQSGLQGVGESEFRVVEAGAVQGLGDQAGQ